MKFTPPVIAAISALTLVISALIVSAILYAKGFFDDKKEPEKPTDPSPKDELTKSDPAKGELAEAVEKAKPYLNNNVISNALLTVSFESDDVKKEIKAWETSTLKTINDMTAFETIFDAFLQSSKVMLEKVRKCGDDQTLLTKAIAESLPLYSCFLKLSEKAEHLYYFKHFEYRVDPSLFVRSCNSDEKMRIGMKILMAFQYIAGIDYRDPKNAGNSQEDKDYMDKLNLELETFF